MKPERRLRSQRFIMKGPALVETKSQIRAVNIKKNNKVIQEHLKLAQVLILRSRV